MITLVDERTHAMLVALGPGGTRELAERALAYADSQSSSARHLGGPGEVAELLGWSRQKLGHISSNRRGDGSFPPPVLNLQMGPVWDLDEVTRWFRRVEDSEVTS